jgi:ribosomal protein L5
VAAYDSVYQKHLLGGETAGVRVSLRGAEAYEFLEKLALLLLPQQVGEGLGRRGRAGS